MMNLAINKKSPSAGVLGVWAALSLLAGMILSGSIMNSLLILFGFTAISYLNERRVIKGKTALPTFMPFLLYSVALMFMPLGLPLWVPLVGLYLDRYIYRHIQDNNGKLTGAGVLDIIIPMFAVLAIEVACNNLVWVYTMLFTPVALSLAARLCLLVEIAFFALLWLFIKTLVKGIVPCAVLFASVLAVVTLFIGIAASASIILMIVGLLLVAAAACIVSFVVKGAVFAATFNLNRALLLFFGLIAIIAIGFAITLLLSAAPAAICGSLFAVLRSLLC